MEAPEDRPGRWVIPRGRAETALWLERILRDGRIDIEDPAVAARDLVTSPEALALLAADDKGQLIIQAAELRRRAAGLEERRVVVEDPNALERDLQRVLEGQHWIFGGRFVGEAAHRRLVPGDEVDLPLIRGDGALHIVELKRAMSLKGPLVKRHRSAWVPAAQVTRPWGRPSTTWWDSTRTGTAFARSSASRPDGPVCSSSPETQPSTPTCRRRRSPRPLRTVNAHMSRVEVVTYTELLDNAGRSLAGPEEREDEGPRVGKHSFPLPPEL